MRLIMTNKRDKNANNRLPPIELSRGQYKTKISRRVLKCLTYFNLT